MAEQPRDFNHWVKSVERRLQQSLRNGQSPQAVRLAREVQQVRDKVDNIEASSSPVPAAPIELVVQTRILPDLTGTNQGEVSVDFPDVVRDVDANPIEVDRYELWVDDLKEAEEPEEDPDDESWRTNLVDDTSVEHWRSRATPETKMVADLEEGKHFVAGDRLRFTVTMDMFGTFPYEDDELFHSIRLAAYQGGVEDPTWQVQNLPRGAQGDNSSPRKEEFTVEGEVPEGTTRVTAHFGGTVRSGHIEFNSPTLFNMSEEAPVAPSAQGWKLVSTAVQSSVAYSPLTVGADYDVRVRAVASGVPGPFSVTRRVTVEPDRTPPPIPSALTLTSSGATVTASWDLLAGTGNPMPADFSNTEVAYGYNPAPTDVVGSITNLFSQAIFETPQPGSDVDFDGTYYFRHRSVDSSGNRSGWSATSSIVPKQLVDTASMQFEFDAFNRERIDPLESSINEAVGEAQDAIQSFRQEWDENWDPEAMADLEARQGTLESDLAEGFQRVEGDLQEFRTEWDENWDPEAISGLVERADGLEATLAEKASASELDQLSTLLAGRERVSTGEGEPDETTAARGITYEWAGDPNASESIKYVDGVEVARNRLIQPILSDRTRAWSSSSQVSLESVPGSGVLVIADAGADVQSTTQVLTLAAQHAVTRSDGDITYSFFKVTNPPEAPRPIQLRPRIITYYSDDTSTQWGSGTDVWIDPGETVELFYESTALPNATHSRVALMPGTSQNFIEGDSVLIHDGWTVQTNAETVEMFHGDTADELSLPATEGTIYYQVDDETSSDPAILAIWRRGDGEWKKLPLRDEAFSSISVGKLVAGDASFDTGVVNRLWGQLGVFDRLDAREGWIGGVALGNGVVAAEHVDMEDFTADTGFINNAFVHLIQGKMANFDEALIGGALLKNNSISVEKLSVTSFDNLNLHRDMVERDDNPLAWRTDEGSWSSSSHAGFNHSGVWTSDNNARYFYGHSGHSNGGPEAWGLRCEPGETVAFTYRYAHSGELLDGNTGGGFVFGNAAGERIYYSTTDVFTDSVGVATLSMEAPEDAVYFGVFLRVWDSTGGTKRFGDVRIFKKTGSVEIADGAIKAHHGDFADITASDAFIDNAFVNLIQGKQADIEDLMVGRIISESATVSRDLIVGSTENLFGDPSLEKWGDPDWWNERTGSGWAKSNTTRGPALRFVNTGQGFSAVQSFGQSGRGFLVYPGQELILKAQVNRPAGSSGTLAFRPQLADIDGSHIGFVDLATISGHEGWRTREEVITVPDENNGSPMYMVPEFVAYSSLTGDAWIAQPSIREATSGRMVVNGLLQATTGELQELFFDTAVGNTIAVGAGEFITVETGNLAANAVTADKISFGSLNGALITGLQIQTHTNNRGVKITSAGIRAFNSSGTETFTVDASNGDVSARGGTFTGARIHGGEITSTVSLSSEIQVGPRWTGGSGSGGVLIRNSSTYGNILAYDDDGNVSARIGGGRHLFTGAVEADSVALRGELRVGVGSIGEGGLTPVGDRLDIRGRIPEVTHPETTFVTFSTPYSRAREWYDNFNSGQLKAVVVHYEGPAPRGSRLPQAIMNITSGSHPGRGASAGVTRNRTNAYFTLFMGLTDTISVGIDPNIAVTVLSVWGQTTPGGYIET